MARLAEPGHPRPFALRAWGIVPLPAMDERAFMAVKAALSGLIEGDALATAVAADGCWA